MHISKHSSFRLKITVGCLTSTYPSIHFSLDEDTLKITVGCLTSAYPSVHKTLKITVGCRLCCERVCTLGVVACVCMYMWRCVYMLCCVCGVLCCVVVLWCGVVVWYVARLGARNPSPPPVLMSSTPLCVHFKAPPCVLARRPHIEILNLFTRPEKSNSNHVKH